MELKKKGGGIIGETFEGIMSSWDNSSTTEGAARLPLISGTSSMGYKVVGETIIDEEWYPEASKLLWVTDTNGYVKASYSKDNILRYGKPSTYASKGFMHLHRYVKGVSSEVEYMVDHVNGDRRDNRNTNLRLANSLQNGRNSKVIKAGSSKYKGVYLTHRSDRCWKATLMVRGVRVFQKYFFCEIEAAKYYDAYLRYNYPSEFNVYNFPQEDERSAIL
ncbi:putative homing endonuclease [Vibrio phage 277E43-1]|nr:putative homing endonuclease [Vibrio phage 277E43-1]